MKSVQVDPRYFTEVEFKGAAPKEEFGKQGEQKLRNGVPVWAVRVAVAVPRRDGRIDDDFITVTVPSESNPADTIARGEAVRFVGLMFGVAQTKSGYSTWFSADGIEVADKFAKAG